MRTSTAALQGYSPVPAKTMMGRLMVVGKDASVLLSRLKRSSTDSVSFLHRLAEIGALASLNVLEDDSRSDEALADENRVEASGR